MKFKQKGLIKGQDALPLADDAKKFEALGDAPAVVPDVKLIDTGIPTVDVEVGGTNVEIGVDQGANISTELAIPGDTGSGLDSGVKLDGDLEMPDLKKKSGCCAGKVKNEQKVTDKKDSIKSDDGGPPGPGDDINKDEIAKTTIVINQAEVDEVQAEEKPEVVDEPTEAQKRATEQPTDTADVQLEVPDAAPVEAAVEEKVVEEKVVEEKVGEEKVDIVGDQNVKDEKTPITPPSERSQDR